MQIQRITPYTNKYSPNKAQQPSAKTNAAPNFGLNLSADKTLIDYVQKNTGLIGVTIIESAIGRMGQDANLTARFNRIFKEKLKHIHGSPFVQDFVNRITGDLNPIKLIQDWYAINVSLKYSARGKTEKIKCFEGQKFKGLSQLPQDKTEMVRGIIETINNALDVYAERKLSEAFSLPYKPAD